MKVKMPLCRFCESPLRHTFADLGVTPLANHNLAKGNIANEKTYPLIARVCDRCFLVQVDDSVSPDDLFSDYDYFSSYSDSWVAHAGRYCDDMNRRFDLGAKSFIIEIASNDGYLLQHFKKSRTLGIEPAANVAQVAIARGIPTDIAFFGVTTAERIAQSHGTADLMIANNVLAHAPNIRDFVGGFAALLSPEGVATFEFPHLLRLIRETQFDTIYHEHFFYLSLLTVEQVMAAAGLRVFDVEELKSHGGSLRVFVCRSGAKHATTTSVAALRTKEEDADLNSIHGYQGFAGKIERVKKEFLDYLESAEAAGRKVAAYGAAAKGNTFLNVCEVGHPRIKAVYDRSVAKQSKLTPGSHIPILSPDQVLVDRPDDLIILPWNLSDEVIASLTYIREWGGRFIVAIPNLQIM